MADLSDVENALVAVIAQVFYPAGTAQPSALGVPVRIYRGWPSKPELESDLRSGAVNVSVYALNRERVVTRFQTNWRLLTGPPAPTLTFAVSGNTITVGGTVTVPQNAAVIVDNGLREGSAGYSYALQPADTPTTIATALAALITAGYPGTTSSGPVITVPGAARLVGRAGTFGSSIRELKRQRRDIQIALWASTPGLRDQVAILLDPALAALEFIALADGTAGRLVYVGSPHDDTVQKEILYRRNLIYSVEYGTTQTRSDAAIIVPVIDIAGGFSRSTTTPIKTIVS
jgi:hypothetical protein